VAVDAHEFTLGDLSQDRFARAVAQPADVGDLGGTRQVIPLHRRRRKDALAVSAGFASLESDDPRLRAFFLRVRPLPSHTCGARSPVPLTVNLSPTGATHGLRAIRA